MERTSVKQPEAIRNQARADLMIPTEGGTFDVFLWEHSIRVARYAAYIARLPEVRAASPDEDALLAAALYHDAGWLVGLRNEEIRRDDILIGTPPDSHFERGAQLMEESLGDLLSEESLARASRAIRMVKDQRSDSIEAHIVSDADNLDEFGIVSLWLTARRGLGDGKGVEAAIGSWRRKSEYRFWEARLRDSFRFTPVRELAARRLASLGQLMGELEVQHQALDVQSLSPNEPTVPPAASPVL